MANGGRAGMRSRGVLDVAVFGQQARRRREQLGWKQEQVARFPRLRVSRLSRLENGKLPDLSLEDALQLAELYGLPMAQEALQVMLAQLRELARVARLGAGAEGG